MPFGLARAPRPGHPAKYPRVCLRAEFGIAVILAGLRVLGPVAAAIFHQIGSLLVILNAMRLLGGRDGISNPLVRLRRTLDPLRPSRLLAWSSSHRGRLAAGFAVLALLGWIGSGIAIIGPDQVGLLRRFGRFVPPVLEPGLHWRLPRPLETVSLLPPDLVRTARVGLVESKTASAAPIAWNATHGSSRDDSALFFTGDENLVEVAGVVEYQDTEEGACAAPSPSPISTSPSRPPANPPSETSSARSTLEDLLVAERTRIERDIKSELRTRLARCGSRRADPPCPSCRRPPARARSSPPTGTSPPPSPTSSASATRPRPTPPNAPSPPPPRLVRFAKPPRAKSHALKARIQAESDAFLARESAHAAQPGLTEFRLLWSTLGLTLADRPKLILDPKAGGRRQVWLADPERFGLGALSTLANRPPEPIIEPED